MAYRTGQEYLDGLTGNVPGDHNLRRALDTARGYPRVFYLCSHGTGMVRPDEVLAAARSDIDAQRHAVCVIEDIDREWIAAIGSEWHIDFEFFITHASNPERKSLWDAVTEPQAHRCLNQNGNRMHCIEGVVPHTKKDQSPSLIRRNTEFDFHYGWQRNTRVSYCRISKYLHLFLVDRPLEMATSRLSMWVPYSSNRGGLPIPQLYGTAHFSMFDSFRSFFSHKWHLNVLFSADDAAFDYVQLSYILSVSLWNTNLRFLDSEIKRISFQDLRRPSVIINDRLHDLRQDLNTLRDEVKLARDWMPAGYDSFQRAPNAFPTILDDSEALGSFLIDTFQLLMSTISVLDSQASILDARRGARLTQLATIYVPLSFVTGVWGMNVKEINGSPLSVWTAAVALVIVAFLTAAALWLMAKLPDPTAPVVDKRKTESSEQYRKQAVEEP